MRPLFPATSAGRGTREPLPFVPGVKVRLRCFPPALCGFFAEPGRNFRGPVPCTPVDCDPLRLSDRNSGSAMKEDLHPEYNDVTITLADGTEFVTRSTMDQDTYETEVDSTNHPFYTGRRQFVDTAGRVEKFNRRYGLDEDDEDDEDEEEAEE